MAAIKRDFILSSAIGISADNLYLVNSSNSDSTTSGSILTEGGAGIAKSVSIGGRLQLFNSSNYTAFVSSASGNTVYTLPSSSPATGSSVLQSTSAGVMSWVPMTATSGSSGNATTANNVNVVFASTNLSHPLLFTPSSGSASGLAVSSNTTLVYNPSTDILSVSGISVTSLTFSTSSSTGALNVAGGVGIGQSVSIGGSLQLFNGSNYTAFVSSASGNTVYTLPASSPAIGSSVLQSTSAGVLSWVPMTATASGSGGSGTVSSGSINEIPYYFATGTAITGSPSFTNTGTGISISYSTVSISPISGALTVAGGVGIGGSLFVNAGTAISGVLINSGVVTGSLSGTASTARNIISVTLGTSASDHFVLLSPTNTGSGVAVSSGVGLSFTPSSSTLKIGGLGLSYNIFTTTASTLNLFNANATTVNSFQAGTALSFGATTGTFTVNNATLRANQTTASINTTSGSIVALGGVGIGGSLYVGGTGSSISGLMIDRSVVTSGTWAATAITSLYGGTGYATYSTGDLLVGTGTTLSKFPIGSNNFVLIADTSQPTDLRWGLLQNDSLQNPFIGIGLTTVGLGSTLGLVAGAGISLIYSGGTITIYNRSGVLITSTYPLSPIQGDLFWHDEEGVLKVYYDDTDGAGQWVDANQRWGQGQYVTFPDLGSGDLYEVAFYSGAGHSVSGSNNFTNNTSTNQVAITYSTGSTSSSTGSFIVSGGVGIGGSLYANTVVSNSGFVENVYAGGTAGTGSTIYPNWSQGSVQSYTIAGNCWLGLPTNMPVGASLTLILSQNATGGWGITSDTNIKYAGGNKTLSTTANSIDVINMFNTGSNYLAALTTGYS